MLINWVSLKACPNTLTFENETCRENYLLGINMDGSKKLSVEHISNSKAWMTVGIQK